MNNCVGGEMAPLQLELPKMESDECLGRFLLHTNSCGMNQKLKWV